MRSKDGSRPASRWTFQVRQNRRPGFEDHQRGSYSESGFSRRLCVDHPGGKVASFSASFVRRVLVDQAEFLYFGRLPYTVGVASRDSEGKSKPHWAQVLAWLTAAIVAVIGLAWSIYTSRTSEPPNRAVQSQNDSPSTSTSPTSPPVKPPSEEAPIFTPPPTKVQPVSPPVPVKAFIDVSPPSGPPGTRVTVSGVGFRSLETVKIDFPKLLPKHRKANENGSFSGVWFEVPNLPRGALSSFKARGLTSNKVASKRFEIRAE